MIRSIISLALCLIPALMIAQVGQVGGKKLSMRISGHTLQIPYFSNLSLSNVDEGIAHAVIVIHGNNRDADNYFNNMSAAALRAEDADSTVIIAPQFLTEDDIDAFQLASEFLYWTSGGWKSGSNSRDENANPRPARIPSYAVLDTLLMRLSIQFPNLNSIVMTGHSAGGQVVNRYSATSPMPSIICDQVGVNTKFIVANPSSYVYLDDQRRVGDSLDTFAKPSTNCDDYNEWKYGLEDLFQYPDNIGVDSIRNLLKNRQVIYLLGEADNDPNASSLDVSCEAKLQGNHRLERGMIYFNYLQHYYGAGIKVFQSIVTVPHAGHSNFDMYTSIEGIFHLFESPIISCSGPAPVSTREEHSISFSLHPNPASDYIRITTTDVVASATIYNINGTIALERSDFNPNDYQIDIRHLPAGTYCVVYQSGTAYISKMIVKF